MTTINRLGGTDVVKDNDLVPIYKIENRRTRNVAAVDLAEYVSSIISGAYAPISHVGSGGAQHSLVTGASAGFMAPGDFTKLSGIESGAQNNTASNLGAGVGVFAAKTGSDLAFKSLTAGSNITLTPSGTEIQISATVPDQLNAPIATVAAASTINLTSGAPNTANVVISGTGVSISSFVIESGRDVFIRFSGLGTNTIVSGASINTQTGNNIVVGRGHTMALRATAENVVEILWNTPNEQPQNTDSATDLNTIQSPGPYPLLIGGSPGGRNPNHPDGNTAIASGNGVANFYWITVERFSTNCFQYARPYISGSDTSIATIKYRMLGGGIWSPWRSLPVSSALPFTRSFTSSPQTVTAGGGLTIAHGLPSAPFFVSIEFVCTVADAGYAVGDRLQRPAGGSGMGGGSSVEVWPDATNLNVRFGSLSFSVAHKTTGAQTALTLTSWQAVLRAFV